MQSFTIWHRVAVIVAIIVLLSTSYTTILINNFKTPETTAEFFQDSSTYYYIAEIVKTDIRAKYPLQLQTNVIKLAIADNLLTAVITPNLIARLAQPILQAREKIAQLPTSFAGSNLVLNTKQYTSQLSTTINSLNLPSQLQDTANKLIASIPPQITLVDTQKHPNSILASITRTRIFFDHVKTVQTVSGVLLVISIVALFIINLRTLRRLTRGLIWVFGTSGIIMLLANLLSNPFAQAFSNSTDPVTGVLQDQLVEHIVTYYFSETLTLSIIFIVVAIGLYLLYRFAPYEKVDRIMAPPTTQRANPSSIRPRKRTR